MFDNQISWIEPTNPLVILALLCRMEMDLLLDEERSVDLIVITRCFLLSHFCRSPDTLNFRCLRCPIIHVPMCILSYHVWLGGAYNG
jgi:hypothetical protein